MMVGSTGLPLGPKGSTCILHGSFIRGQWVEDGCTSRNINPSDVENVIGEYAYTDKRQAEEAITAARSASAPYQDYAG
jgi:acyl-CoA reductase-like NAD-dependent aldehyde dehydrogenase